jgi:anhydro-N-acetylmuramic acid kinase
LEFIDRNSIRRIDLIASHGHTIFHQPSRRFTYQLGDGAALHATTGLPVVFDFRSLDVQLGGEGAPLVPVGDRHLFASSDVCLNLGGIANLSMEVGGERRAFDLCFCNMALNFLANEAGKSYDRSGKKASKGSVDDDLLESLSGVYASIRKKRKSIGRELFEEAVRPLLVNKHIRLADRLRTVCESVAQEVEDALPRDSRNLQILTTGGGALNKFLVEVIKNRLFGKGTVALPAREIIDFKEAIVFAFLGVLRKRNENNVLRSVTRAKRDSCSGSIIGL